MSFETVTDASVEHRRTLVSGFVAGALVVTTLGVLACASTGSQSAGGGAADAADKSAPTERAAQAPPAAPPAAVPPTPAPAAPTPVPAVAAAATGDSPVPGYLADPAAMQRASQLFRAVCTGYCHSTQPTAERVAPNLFDCEWAHGSSDQEIFHTISAGVPDTQMQGFGERLPNEDLWKMVAFIRQKSTCKG